MDIYVNSNGRYLSDNVNMNLQARIEQAAKEKDLNRNQIAKAIGAPRQTVGAWFNGDSKEIASKYIYKVEKCLGVRGQWLNSGSKPKYIESTPLDSAPQFLASNEPATETKQSSKSETGHDPGFELGPELNPKEINLIGWIEAGFGSEAVDPYEPGDGEGTFRVVKNFGNHTYALRVKGDSMKNPNGRPSFEDGDIIIVDPDLVGDETTGSLIIALFKDEAIPMHRRVTFKQLVREGTTAYLKPLNPTHDNIYDEFEVIGVFINQIL